ncbi:MAG: ABC transporter ATP-binding protein [Anaerolineales bacterium]|nr:ABC transporter ATP-binding protein [Anaerolineales bacterium]
MSENKQPLLEIKNLKTYFFTEDGVVRAVDGVDFYVNPGEVLGIVGESGCGKSVTALSIMRLISQPGKIEEGEIFFDGKDLVKATEQEMMQVRGNRISMIFQQPQSALNPVIRAGDQISEVLNIHQDFGKEAGKKRAIELLKLVGIPEPESRAESFPHELSGGMAQRVMIAMALACVPDLLIADEPTTALDVTIQAQILDLMRDMRTQLGSAMILITHDLGVIAEMADRVAVMYAGEIVEQSPVVTLFDRPLHPYTKGLLGSIPVLGEVRERLDVIPGSVPNLVNLPSGCRFAPRCMPRIKYNLSVCTEKRPELVDVASGHKVRCWLYQDSEEQNHVAPINLGNKS